MDNHLLNSFINVSDNSKQQVLGSIIFFCNETFNNLLDQSISSYHSTISVPSSESTISVPSHMVTQFLGVYLVYFINTFYFWS